MKIYKIEKGALTWWVCAEHAMVGVPGPQGVFGQTTDNAALNLLAGYLGTDQMEKYLITEMGTLAEEDNRFTPGVFAGPIVEVL